MSDQLTHELDKKRGYGFPAFDILKDLDPGYDVARRGLTAYVYTPEQSLLSVKEHEIINAAVLSSRFYPSAETHFRRALREGASMRELVEALEAAAVPGGGPTMHFGLEILTKIATEANSGGA